MKKYLALVATASLMFSCSQEEIIPDVERIPINISVGQQTRANDTIYENGDEVGIYVVNYDGSTAGSLEEEGNQVDNMRFEYNDNGGTWTPDAPIYWKDKSTSADFYAYYPYDASANVSAHPFSVAADQSAEANFWASDFLWGKATKVSPTKSAVPIVTNHSLSRILVDIKSGNGFTENAWAAATKSVKICDVKTSATIDLSTGIATATGNNGEIIPLAAAKTGTTLSYQAMMIPQVVADNSKLIVVTVDDVDYVYRKGFTFKANTQHKFTITVNKSGSSVDVTIGEWTTEEIPDEGTAEEESESESTIPNNQIWYTATAKVEPYKADAFGATIVSNEWDSTTGEGVITFNGNVTSIGRGAFEYCSTLTSISIPDSVIDIYEVNPFRYCRGLISFYGKFASADGKVLIVNNELKSYALGCSDTSYIIPENITSIASAAFTGSVNLKYVTISNNVKTISLGAFHYCPNLEAFYGKFAFDDNRCLVVDGVLTAFAPSGLTSYDIPEIVTEIGDVSFKGIDGLKHINIPNTVTAIRGQAFYNCRDLNSIIIPESVESIHYDAFRHCSLETVFCKSTTPPTGGEKMFEEMLTSTIIYVPANAVDAYKEANYWTDYADLIMPYDFENNKPVVANSQIHYTATAKVNPSAGAFGKTISSNEWNASTGEGVITFDGEVTKIGYGAFRECRDLTSVIIPNGVISIENFAFGLCSNLKTITIPDSVTNIEGNPFYSCQKIEAFYGKFASEDNLCLIIEDVLKMYATNNSATDFTVPDNVNIIEEYAFYGSSNLINLTISDNLKTISKGAFYGCANLANVILGNSITTISGSAFCSCVALANVVIPDSVTEVGDHAFENCKSLKKVTIGSNVKAIKTAAFAGCIDLVSVYCKPITPPIEEVNIFYNNASNRKVYVPYASIDSYISYWGASYEDILVAYDFEKGEIVPHNN